MAVTCENDNRLLLFLTFINTTHPTVTSLYKIRALVNKTVNKTLLVIAEVCSVVEKLSSTSGCLTHCLPDKEAHILFKQKTSLKKDEMPPPFS